MNKELKEKWITALRSGEYKQGQTLLHSDEDNSYCCLGVLGKILLGHDPEQGDKHDDEEYLNIELSEEAGITYDDQQFLARMNDGSPYGDDEFMKPHTFNEIAAYIEKNL